MSEMAAEYRVELPYGMPMLSSNMRLHYMERYRRNKGFKDSAFYHAKSLKIPPLLRVDIAATVRPGPRTGLFDPHNYMASVKGAIDGLVLAGVLPKDDSRYLRRVTIEAGPAAQDWQLVLVITPLQDEPVG